MSGSLNELHPTPVNYRLLIEHIPAITYIAAFDETSSTIYTSPQIEMLLGFSQAEWMADPLLWFKQIYPDDRAFVHAELEHLRAGGDPVACEYRMLTRDRRVMWVRDHAAIRYDAAGQPQFLYGVILDITGYKVAMSELSGTRSRLAASMAMLLDKREVQILRRLCDGCSCCAIGQELGMAERTVRYAITRACRKLGVERRAEALRKAGRLGLLDT